MDYSAMIQNRKSVRAFLNTEVPDAILNKMDQYFSSDCKRLIPSINTEIRIFGHDVREKLEGAAGYREFMIGAPNYLLVLSEEAEYFTENAGYLAEDLILKLLEWNLNSCWLTFDDEEKIKKALELQSEKHVAAIVAFGYGKKTSKKIRFNIRSMSDIDSDVNREYFSPRLGIDDLVFAGKWGEKNGVYDAIGDMDHMLWRAFYAASLAPSYLNRQPYGFVLDGDKVVLVAKEDKYTDEKSEKLNLGIVMLHFAAVVSQMAGNLTWVMEPYEKDLGLPPECRAVAHCKM